MKHGLIVYFKFFQYHRHITKQKDTYKWSFFSTHYSTMSMEHLTTDNYLKSIYRLFQRTANTRCSLKHLISNTIVHSFKFFVLFTLLISLYITLWNLCKYFYKYPRMQQYVIFNVLKEYCIPKEEDNITSDQWHAYMI
jgi:hypothetical protein